MGKRLPIQQEQGLAENPGAISSRHFKALIMFPQVEFLANNIKDCIWIEMAVNLEPEAKGQLKILLTHGLIPQRPCQNRMLVKY